MFLHLSVILFTGRVDTPWADTPSQADTPGRPPPPKMATAADGAHLTGMHSCYVCNQVYFVNLLFVITLTKCLWEKQPNLESMISVHCFYTDSTSELKLAD